MSNISNWAQGLIIAVIIGTIIQMILPENKNKKYIKVIIGVYILFCIINPAVGKSINLDDYDIEKYINLNEEEKNTEFKYDEEVNKLFEENIKKSIKDKINSKGYESDEINIEYGNNYDITSIQILNIYEYTEENLSVNKVEIDIKKKPAAGIDQSDKIELLEYFSSTYNIEKSNIEIN